MFQFTVRTRNYLRKRDRFLYKHSFNMTFSKNYCLSERGTICALSQSQWTWTWNLRTIHPVIYSLEIPENTHTFRASKGEIPFKLSIHLCLWQTHLLHICWIARRGKGIGNAGKEGSLRRSGWGVAHKTSLPVDSHASERCDVLRRCGVQCFRLGIFDTWSLENLWYVFTWERRNVWASVDSCYRN